MISMLLLSIILLPALLAISLLPAICLLLLRTIGLLLAVVSWFIALLLAVFVSVVSLFIAGLSGPLRFCAIAVVGFVLLPIVAVYLRLMAMGIGVATLSAYGFGRTPAALRFSVRFIFRSFAQSFRQGGLLYRFPEELFNLLEIIDIVFVDQGNGYTVAVGPCCTTNAMHIVFGIVGHIVVNNHGYIIDIDTSRYDVGGNNHIELPALELEHHVVSLRLFKVGVHFSAVYVLLLQRFGNLLNFLF